MNNGGSISIGMRADSSITGRTHLVCRDKILYAVTLMLMKRGEKVNGEPGLAVGRTLSDPASSAGSNSKLRIERILIASTVAGGASNGL